MKTIDKIPTSKIQRASKLFKTGAKVGVNYLKYYSEKSLEALWIFDVGILSIVFINS